MVLFDLASDAEGFGVGEFDADGFLLEAWEVTVQLVSVVCLFDIELGGEGFWSFGGSGGFLLGFDCGG